MTQGKVAGGKPDDAAKAMKAELRRLNSLYDRGYYEGGKSNYEGYTNDPGWAPTVSVLTEWLPAKPRVLELGCATGWFVKAANEAGWACEGIDCSAWAHMHAEASTVYGDASDLSDWDAGTFDAVVSWEFLEHLRQARVHACLSEIERVVKPGGLMVHRIGMDLEGDESYARYPHPCDDDPTHETVRPRWWWESLMAVSSHPVRKLEEQLNVTFSHRDWWGRFYARRMK